MSDINSRRRLNSEVNDEVSSENNSDQEKRKNIKAKLKTIKSRALLIFYGLLIVGVLVTAIVFSVYTFFKINKINIEGSNLYTNEQVIEASGISIGESLLFADTKAAEANIKRELLYIEDVSLNKSIPSTLNIKVTQAVPTYSVEFEGRYIYVSAKGKVLEISHNVMAGTMIISGGDVVEKNGYLSFADEKVNDAFNGLINAISETGTAGIDYIDISNVFNINAKYDDRVILEFGSLQDLEYKMKFAVNIINNENGIGENERGTLDLSLARETNKSYFTPDIIAQGSNQQSGEISEFNPSGEITSRGEDIPDV